MIKIGDFARLTQTSIRSLRHYDQLGLFQPAYVNQDSGHRYYTLEQLPRLHRIRALQNLGLSLKEIGRLLEENITAEAIRGMLLLKQAETRQILDDAELRLSQVENYLHLIENEGQLPHLDVVVKELESWHVASLQRTVTNSSQIQQVFIDLAEQLDQAGIAYQESIGIYHTQNLPEDHVYAKLPYHIADDELECAFRLEKDLSHRTHKFPFKLKTLPPVNQVASVVYQGSYFNRGEGSLALYNWAEDNHYQFGSPIREIYLKVNDNNLQHPQNLVEIQFPIFAK